MTLEPDDVQLIRRLLEEQDSWYQSQAIDQLHQDFCQWNGSLHAYAFMGGRVALSACLAGLGLKPGDEVIVPGYTCVVVPNAVQFAGLHTVYADIELETYGLSLEDVKRKATPRTKAIVVQHLFGLVCKEFEQLLDWAQTNGVYVIEDCAHSTGAIWNGQRVGNFGDAGFYSCEQSKVLNTGQGGIAVTNSDQIATRMARFYLDAGFPDESRIEQLLFTQLLNYYQQKSRSRWLLADWYEFRYGKNRLISTTDDEMGGRRPSFYGQKMPGAIAQLAINQLAKVDRFNEQRRETAKRWFAWCQENQFHGPTTIENSTPVFLRYPVMVREEMKADRSWSNRLGVKLGVWFVSNVHPADREVDGCPNADLAVKCCVNFPTLMN